MRREDQPQLSAWQPVDMRRAAMEGEVMPAEPPGSVAPIPLLSPFGGPTPFKFLYDQLTSVESRLTTVEGGGGGGSVVTTNVNNIFTAAQSIAMDDVTNLLIPLSIDINNAAPGVSYPLQLTHRYSPGVGPNGLGVGINMLVESGTEGQTHTVATFEGQQVDNTVGTIDSEAGVNVTINDVSTRVLTVGDRYVRIAQEPIASTSKALMMVGNSGFAGSAQGTAYGGRIAGGFTGDLVNLFVGSVSKFRVDQNGAIYQNGVLLAAGGDALIGSSNAWSAAQTFTVDDATANAASYPVRVRHTVASAAGQNNIGVGIQFEAENTATTVSTLGNLAMIATNDIAGNLTTQYRFGLFNNASARADFMLVGPTDVRVPYSPPATANNALLSLGSGSYSGGFQGNSAGTFIGANMDPGYAGDYLSFQELGALRTLIAGTGETTHYVWDSSTNTVVRALSLRRRLTTGTAAAGIGVSLDMRGINDAGGDEFWGSIAMETQVVDSNTHQSEMVFRRRRNLSITEVMRFDKNDQVIIPVDIAHTSTKLGFRSSTPVTKPTVTGSRGGNAALASLLTGLALQGIVLDSSSA